MMRSISEEYRICKFCQKAFVVRGYHLRTDRKKYCSKICKHKGLAIHALAQSMPTDQSAWLAGLFDGEGWISWPDPKCLTTFRIGIASTSHPLLLRVQEVTGTGRIRERTRTNSNHSRFWVWYCYSANARAILDQIAPWLIVKKESAEIAIGKRHADVAPLTARGKAQRHPKNRSRSIDGPSPC